MAAAKNFEDQSFKNTTKNLVISGLALAAALAWNEAITTTLKTILPNSNNDSISLIIYAVIITVFSFLVIRLIDRYTRDKIPATVTPAPVATTTPPSTSSSPVSAASGRTSATRKVSD